MGIRWFIFILFCNSPRLSFSLLLLALATLVFELLLFLEFFYHTTQSFGVLNLIILIGAQRVYVLSDFAISSSEIWQNIELLLLTRSKVTLMITLTKVKLYSLSLT